MSDVSMSINAEFKKMEAEFTIRGRANLSQYHMLASLNAANTASQIEDKLAAASLSQPELDNYLSQVSTAIICSVAAIEATINEFVVDSVSRLDKMNLSEAMQINYKIKNTSLPSRQILSITCIIDKVDIMWTILKNTLLPENTMKQDVRYLCRLRNALIHFTPEWDNDLANHAALEQQLKNQFKVSPLYDPGCLFIPYRCLSASCALWAHITSRDFISFFKLNIHATF